MRVFEYQELAAATEGFSPARLIGKGSHGWVYKGTVVSKDDDHIQEVAIKKSSIQDNTKLENEVKVLSFLHQNPNVINILGTSNHQSKLLVMDLMHNGSLYDLLHSKTPPPLWPQRVDIAGQIARAVRSLHGGDASVIHRDIKSANILFDAGWNVKLADFGLAVMSTDGVVLRVDSLSQPAGTMGYLDPCYTSPSKLSTKNDVFSFGVVLLEIFSCRKVIDVCKAPADIVEWAVPAIGRRRWTEICDNRVPLPSYMEGTVVHMLHIAMSCVSTDEKRRPTMAQVVDRMEGCFVERIRFPIWASFVILVKRRRRLALRRLSGGGEEKESGEINILGAKKMLLREVLGEVLC